MHFENASVELVRLELLPLGELELVGELAPHAAVVIAAASTAAAVSSRTGRNGGIR
jgi:hypothetical protein